MGDFCLHSVLQRFLNQISFGKFIALHTSDGIELLNVKRDGSCNDSALGDDLVKFGISKALEQALKFNLGASKYSLTWSDSSVHVQFKIEAIIVSVVVEENSNLGLMDNYVNSLHSILKPFATSSFINHHG